LKILILKPSSLGDVVQALPVLRLLKQQRPSAEVHWWIDARLAPLLEGDRDLAGLVRFERERLRSPRCWLESWRSLRRLRQERFDWVIDLQALARSGLVAWLARGCWTVGLEDPREGAATFYDLRVPRPSPTTHAVDWYLAVLRRLEVPVHGNFDWLPPRADIATQVHARWPSQGVTWVGLQPGARWMNKRWPAEGFADVVERLANDRPDLRFAVFGGRDEQSLAATVCAVRPDRCLNLAGQISLPEMVEWIRRCRLMLSNDTGPMHVAAALGKPVVALFGPTEPRRTGPYGQIDRVLQEPLACVPCMKSRCRHPRPLECLQLITVSRVCDAVRKRLVESPDAS
jgi:lipopolysaccharide heptosyltransferase II